MIYALLILFYIFSAICEAAYFDLKHRTKSPFRIRFEHAYLVAMRLPVWGMTVLIGGWVVAIGTMLVFPLIHDGVYYMARHNMNNYLYQDGFADTSEEDTAILSFNFTQRVLLAVAGVIVVSAAHYWNL